MAQIKLTYEQNLTLPVIARQPGAFVFTGDNDSTEIAVALVDENGAASVSGSVVGYAIRANNSTVVLTGTLSENVASVVLPAACFAYPGPLAVSVQVVSGTTKTTVFKGGYYVDRSTTGSIIDPGSVVPDLSDLLARLDEMEQATDAANAAATKSVRYDSAQTLTDAQKAQALANIGLTAVDDGQGNISFV